MGTDDARWARLRSDPPSRFSRWWMDAAEYVDQHRGWDSLPLPLGILTLIGLRDRLRHDNLFDVGTPFDAGWPQSDYLPPQQCAYRTVDGTWNDLDQPRMGAAGSPFGRNVAPAAHQPESGTLLTPNPRVVSRTLLTRDRFLPARTVNVLAAAWLQFEIHDWFGHGSESQNPIMVGLEDGDPWAERPMRVERSRSTGPGVFPNADTHWWDGSQVYGTSAEQQDRVRDGARLRIEDGVIPSSLTGTFFRGNAGLWTGWAALHTLFALEHNAICDHLEWHEKQLRRDQERLFQTARLVNAALMAKIHTTEWTPAIIAHPTTQKAMRMNWWGISKKLRRALGRVSTREAISGIPGSPVKHFGTPYSLTEEFIASYRMHPLLPDEFTFLSPAGDRSAPLSFTDLHAAKAIPALRELTMPNVLHTFGTCHPGQITLHNYPRSLQQFDNGGKLTDLGTVDILRDRERGVPRYNRFREALHKAPVRSFDELTSSPVWREEIREVYDGDLDTVDLMIGLLAEPPPSGFAFSDTAFRIFILMATRRLKSDRFFTDCYDEDHYTAAGLDWIDRSGMRSMLLRHYGTELGAVLDGVDNPFQPWPQVGSGRQVG